MKTKLFLVLVLSVYCVGCASVKHKVQEVWGSSVKHLEEARADSIYKSIPCSYQECYEALHMMIEEEGYTLFQERPEKGLLVVMNVEKAVDTTEVGIFLTPLSSNQTEVELASLSTPAKKTLSRRVFAFLDGEFIHREHNTLDF